MKKLLFTSLALLALAACSSNMAYRICSNGECTTKTGYYWTDHEGTCIRFYENGKTQYISYCGNVSLEPL
jgi:uncharacterized protein YcfL